MPTPEEIIESVTTLIEGVLALPILERHKRDIISRMVWKITEAHGKYTTRYRSRAHMNSVHARKNHDHVFTRKDLTDRIIAKPDRAREILRDAIACVVTEEEHRRLTRLGEAFSGWDRYKEAGIDVIDTEEGTLTTRPPRRYPFWLIDGKLREADFFLDKIRAENDLDSARYLFSAFLSAARSVTYALQKCLGALGDFDGWYEDWRKELETHPNANYFKGIRDQVIHQGLNPLQGRIQDTMTQSVLFYLTDAAPERDVVVAASSYMAILVRIAADAYDRFWKSIDLPNDLTLEDLAERGRTIADVEEELGYPRGWSEGRPAEERLELLKVFSKTEIARLTARYQ